MLEPALFPLFHFPFARLAGPATLLASLGLAGCAATAPPFSSYVVLGEQGAAVARVLIDAPSCPPLELDGNSLPMQLRAGAARLAQRPTSSPPEQSKPSDFAVLACELALPAGSHSAVVLGRALPLPRPDGTAQRIVVIGDTGCRLKQGADGDYQDCNDGAAYPFARVAAAAAAWQPDLVLHVGDYHYRENACPPGRAGCAGSPWGYGWDSWQADFFAPGAALLQAAPWVMARGNHESCRRAGQGYWRFLDPRPLQAGRDCNSAADDGQGDYSDPYAVPLGPDAQLLVLDTAATSWRGLKPGSAGWNAYRRNYQQLEALASAQRYNFGVSHHPLLGFGTMLDKEGRPVLLNGDAGLQQAFGSLNPMLLPAAIQTMLSGHVHMWQQLSFSSDHPSQFISGFAGTAEDIVPPPYPLPPGASPAPGAVVERLSSWTEGFGFMTLERSGPQRWEVTVRDRDGAVRNRCQIDGRRSSCEQARVR